MPKNTRIIEKFVKIHELTHQEIWDRIYSISNLETNDRIRIFEDLAAKEDNNPMLDAYILRKPTTEHDITELEFETVNNRKARLEKEKLNELSSKDINSSTRAFFKNIFHDVISNSKED